jgi:histidinol-phosphate aminotransferase
VGYTLANPSILSVINRVIQPYPIAEPCAQIAVHALSDFGLNTMNESVNNVKACREYFCEQLQNLECVSTVYDSQTNFVLVQFDDQLSAWQQLGEDGIVAREPVISDTIRFTIGTEEQMQRVIDSLHKLTK